MDLVEIAPNAEPPVCRLMDYGKFKYQEQKRQAEARSKQKVIQVKVKFRPATDEGDYQVKLRNLRRFLEEGDKAKVTLRFRGREMAHQELGMRVLSACATIWSNWPRSKPCRSSKAVRWSWCWRRRAALRVRPNRPPESPEPPSGRLWRSESARFWSTFPTGVSRRRSRPGQPRMQVTNPPRPPGRPAGSLMGGSALRCGNQAAFPRGRRRPFRCRDARFVRFGSLAALEGVQGQFGRHDARAGRARAYAQRGHAGRPVYRGAVRAVATPIEAGRRGGPARP